MLFLEAFDPDVVEDIVEKDWTGDGTSRPINKTTKRKTEGKRFKDEDDDDVDIAGRIFVRDRSVTIDAGVALHLMTSVDDGDVSVIRTLCTV
jgi:hypothetical protein